MATRRECHATGGRRIAALFIHFLRECRARLPPPASASPTRSAPLVSAYAKAGSLCDAAPRGRRHAPARSPAVYRSPERRRVAGPPLGCRQLASRLQAAAARERMPLMRIPPAMMSHRAVASRALCECVFPIYWASSVVLASSRSLRDRSLSDQRSRDCTRQLSPSRRASLQRRP
jgi:hypothetical protein